MVTVNAFGEIGESAATEIKGFFEDLENRIEAFRKDKAKIASRPTISGEIHRHEKRCNNRDRG